MTPIDKRPSRHFLPLPSVIFKSRHHLAAETLPRLDEEPDEAVTALPPPAEEPAPAPEQIHQEPVKSFWRRIWNRLKNVNLSFRKAREDPSKELIIGTPHNFQHVYGLTSDAHGNDINYRSLASRQQQPYEYRGARRVVRESVVSADSAWTDIEESDIEE